MGYIISNEIALFLRKCGQIKVHNPNKNIQYRVQHIAPAMYVKILTYVQRTKLAP